MTSYRKDDTGAMTVDWVILTAAIVAMGIGLLIVIDLAKSAQVSQIASEIQSVRN